MKSYPIQVLFREYFEGILASLFLAIFLRFFVVSVLYMPTENMEPVLKKGDFVIGWRLAYGFPLPLAKGERLNGKIPQAGDVVSLRFPGDDEQMIIRRVVAVPGDKVSVQGGAFHVNGKALTKETNLEGVGQEFIGDSQYQVLLPHRSKFSEFVVPEDHVFVLSDNRRRDDDSRSWGAVPVKNVESRLGFVWLSINEDGGALGVDWSRLFQGIR